jgi:hypothetical protein
MFSMNRARGVFSKTDSGAAFPPFFICFILSLNPFKNKISFQNQTGWHVKNQPMPFIPSYFTSFLLFSRVGTDIALILV